MKWSKHSKTTLTLLSALILSPALLLAGLDGLTGRHGCREMWWQWALRSVFLYILDGRLYFPYDLFKTKKTPKILLIYPMNATRRVPILRVASAWLQEIEDALYLGGVLAKPIKWDMYCQTHFIRVNFTVCSLRARRDLCPLGGMPPTWWGRLRTWTGTCRWHQSWCPSCPHCPGTCSAQSS